MKYPTRFWASPWGVFMVRAYGNCGPNDRPRVDFSAGESYEQGAKDPIVINRIPCRIAFQVQLGRDQIGYWSEESGWTWAGRSPREYLIIRRVDRNHGLGEATDGAKRFWTEKILPLACEWIAKQEDLLREGQLAHLLDQHERSQKEYDSYSARALKLKTKCERLEADIQQLTADIEEKKS